MGLRMRASQSINRPEDRGAGPPCHTPAVRRSTTTAPRSHGAIVQRAAAVAPEAWTEVWYYRASRRAPASRHTLRFRAMNPAPGLRNLVIDVDVAPDGRYTAHLEGSMGPDATASINHVAGGRFPRGRGIGYLLINRFAEQAGLFGATRVFLGTPIDIQSTDAYARTAGEAEAVDERAALHMYSQLDYDVATHATAVRSYRSPGQLEISTVAKLAGRWSRHPRPANCCVVS